MVYSGADTFAQGSAVASDSDERAFSVPGSVAAATWTVGLIIGLIALATGHELLAGVSLVLAIMSPWFGLAWVSHSQRARMRHERAFVAQAAPYSGGWPAAQTTAR
ncbi:hypothetical protein A5634_14710 [Mycobacterium asiaticum]|uniref:Uncharacterized protein n=1 Tax=Mycobacterium asiaticum TaxID=1790 RepID=A0A1A3PBL1_MYCAS|nr:hypothetical protein [Mycobacterium asiaticum]OBK31085.1 hypothetical protein A5634_14710 [Mycobacterium asiaticum]